ncbi:MAG: hypothetical protein EG826_08670 [Deltaproteobacteria bacterium]|nr:hypothetical protein [Deltaproteobacteria bacterium]
MKMKKSCLFKMKLLSACLFSLLFIAGCSSSDSDPVLAVKTNVMVHLQAGGNDYLVDGMTVSIQKAGGPVLTGVTGTNGIAVIPVTETGDYRVIKVEGADATNFAEGSQAGREFDKVNPLANPYPNLTYTFGGSFPMVSVTALGSDYPVNASVPPIIKVTVLKVGNITSDDNGNSGVQAGTTTFAGRIIIGNISSNDDRFGLKIMSNDTYLNRLMLYSSATAMTDTYFYGGDTWQATHTGFIDTYSQAGPIYFEAPGTAGGDWALGHNLNATQLIVRGAANQYTNFIGFDGGASGSVVGTWSTAGGTGHTYSFDYRIFQFERFAPYYDIGKSGPGGGTVFYITDGGLHGLEAAPALWNGGSADPIAAWSNIAIAIGTTGTAIGTGLANTQAIILQNGGAASAAKLCRDYTGGGKTDWFLPSRDELTQMYSLRAVIGGLSPGDAYWSSSEHNASDGLLVQNTNGVSANMGKSVLEWVRAVRAF